MLDQKGRAGGFGQSIDRPGVYHPQVITDLW